MIKRETERDLRFLSKEEIAQEPNVRAKYALYSPRTGIIDSHTLMNVFRNMILDDTQNQILTSTKITAIEYDTRYYYLTITQNDEKTVIRALRVVNSAGLDAQGIVELLMNNSPPEYQTYFYKGQYYSYQSNTPLVSRLIYPVPDKHLSKGLGVHATVDLSGRVRFGPDTHYLGDYASLKTKKWDYSVIDNKDEFYASVQQYLRGVDPNKLRADYCGIRPKLQAPGTAVKDFMIQEESEKGFQNFVNLLGIESPGLTSSIPIANYVAQLLGFSDKCSLH
jgi:L-2-hydroxyglutarate oxidase LhgO